MPVKRHFFETLRPHSRLVNSRVKESLGGRCSTYVLHGLSVAEIRETFPELPLKRILYNGGMPELYGRSDLRPNDYLNDYIRSYVEKDVALSAGITKIAEFTDALSLLAARTGQFLNVSEVAGAAGVDQKTVQSWIDLLERNGISKLVQPFHSILIKRIVKMPKFFLLDTGLCCTLFLIEGSRTLFTVKQRRSQAPRSYCCGSHL